MLMYVIYTFSWRTSVVLKMHLNAKQQVGCVYSLNWDTVRSHFHFLWHAFWCSVSMCFNESLLWLQLFGNNNLPLINIQRLINAKSNPLKILCHVFPGYHLHKNTFDFSLFKGPTWSIFLINLNHNWILIKMENDIHSCRMIFISRNN